MRIQRINRDDAEHVDISVVNAQGATITLGYPAAFCTTANSADGANVVLPATSNVASFAGIALKDIANTAAGVVRAYGICNSTAIFATGTSQTVALGIVLGPGAASLGVNSLGLTHALGPVIAMETYGAAVNSPGGYAKTFVRAL